VSIPIVADQELFRQMERPGALIYYHFFSHATRRGWFTFTGILYGIIPTGWEK